MDNSRSRIVWKKDFSNLIKEILPSYYEIFDSNQSIRDDQIPKMRFERYAEDRYLIDFIIPSKIIADLESEEHENYVKVEEGVWCKI